MKRCKNVLFDKNNELTVKERWQLSKKVSFGTIAIILLLVFLVVAVVFCIQDINLRIHGKSVVYEYKYGTSIIGNDGNGNKKEAVLKDKIMLNTYYFQNERSNQTYQNTYGKNNLAVFKDNQGVLFTKTLRFYNHSLLHFNKTYLYYQDNIADARPLIALWAWILLYLVVVLFLVILVHSVYRMMYPKYRM